MFRLVLNKMRSYYILSNINFTHFKINLSFFLKFYFSQILRVCILRFRRIATACTIRSNTQFTDSNASIRASSVKHTQS